MSAVKRKSYSRAKDIPEDILNALEEGSIESATLAEITAIDLKKLILNNYPDLNITDVKSIDESKGILKKMKAGAGILADTFGVNHYSKMLECKDSDTLRGIGAFILGGTENFNISEKMKHITKFASDNHFGVREWAWMGIRDDVVVNFDNYYPYFLKLSKNEAEKIRRFSIEAIRPKGVWAKHINTLKTNPNQAIDLLKNLKNDPSRYVQDSVANWINDLHKDNSDWIKQLCADWENTSKRKDGSLNYIIKRATRNTNYKSIV